jgi:hypothetical protein
MPSSPFAGAIGHRSKMNVGIVLRAWNPEQERKFSAHAKGMKIGIPKDSQAKKSE